MSKTKPCPHCERLGCRSCATRLVIATPTRDEERYWRRGRHGFAHYADHTGAGLYAEGPEDFGAATWAMQAEKLWEKEAAYTIEQADRLRAWQSRDQMHRMVEHLATTPELVTLLRTFILLGAFSAGQRQRVRDLLHQAEEARRKLLQENSVLAAVLRSKARAA